MLLGEIIRDFSQEAKATEALLSCHDIALLARVGEVAERYEETVGEYAAGAVRRFANLATSEDWLSLMNAIERADDPGVNCLTTMIKWSLKQDEAARPVHAGCTCGGGAACS
ncbi:hypothetical protein ACQR1W_26015 [Bradyrhizobium sp. HKCCYLS1011]|uniref:hypothetical protein n=1 Tax=Bradyrhizobium sp. HKCCYLS1011 TaxID=3420733 RepID=UPI003EBC6687